MSAARAHRVFVTGGTGFVAPYLIDLLRAEGCEIIAPGLEDEPFLDIADQASVDSRLRKVRPTCVVHLAGIAAVGDARSAPEKAWAVNFGGTRNLAGAVVRYVPDARFVFVGSADAYGASFMNRVEPVAESAPLQPMSVYAATKAAADIAVGQMSFSGLKCVRFRPFNHTGPGQSEAFVIPAFARQIAQIAAGLQDPVVQVGNVDVERDFLDVRDVVRAYALAILDANPALPGQSFNLASGTPVPLSEVLRMLSAAAGVEIEIRVDPARLRSSDVQRTCGNSTLARTRYGWSPKIALETTLNDVLAYWKARLSKEAAGG